MFDTIFHKIGTAILALSVTISGWFGVPAPVPASPEISVATIENPLGATDKIPATIASFETSLASSIGANDTVMTLVSASYNNGASTLASSTYAFVIDSGTAKEEYVLADCTGTACTNMTRGLDHLTGTTTVTALKKVHGRGASVKITDGPILLILNRIIQGVDTFPNIISYESHPTFTADTQLIDKKYVDDTAFSGAGVIDANTTSRGVVEIATAAEAAASTAQGSSGILALAASNATSTYNQATASNVIVMTDTTGRINPQFVASSTNFTVTATTALATTTTIGSTYAFNIGKNQQVFTNTGTFTRPNGVQKVLVEVIGGGAGGEGTTPTTGGGGGGGGAYCKGFVDLTASSSVAVFIGAAGAADANGGESRFSTFVSAGGGTSGSGQTGGAGGDCTLAGGPTDFLEIENFDGGNAEGDTGYTPDLFFSGKGGNNVYGSGGESVIGLNEAGQAGTGYGSGGSGEIDQGTNNAAGAGMPGIVIVTW